MGICRSFSRSDDSARPFIATADDSATSMLVTPARFARSGSTSSATVNVSAPQSSRTRSAFGCARSVALTSSASARSSSMLSPAMRICTGMPTGLPFSSCRTSKRALAICRDNAACNTGTICGVSCLSFT